MNFISIWLFPLQHIAEKLGFEEETEGKPDRAARFKHSWEEPHLVTYRKKADVDTPEKPKSTRKKTIHRLISK